MKPNEKQIVIVGPRARVSMPDRMTINTTAKTGWQSDLSPFKLGPVTLFDGRVSKTMENGWQYSKVYQKHLSYDGFPVREWDIWSQNGFDNPKAVRYPMGKGKKPAGSWWNNQLLGYIDARTQIYLPLYRDSVRVTEGFRILKQLFVVAQNQKSVIQLWDYDAWDHLKAGYTLKQVLNEPKKIMGHAFILAMMLLYGEDFTPERLP